ncbi:MAG: bifunctional folylpolyglutamate synthase/dihydrofolate synthase [Cytophagales bacterium]
MNYEEVLTFIYHKLPMYHKIGSFAYKPGLENIEKICQKIGNPQQNFKSIHIAGTNGKGSTSHMIAAMLQCQGYKTGLYTSPHLKNFTERIKINGVEVETNFITNFINLNLAVIEELRPSFFEITTAMAFQYFAEKEVDFAVIEVGLGGRLDSTNIITPLLSIITNISYDHQDLLGDTLPEIAFEKAGIIKARVSVVIGEDQPEVRKVFIDKAQTENAPIFFTNDIFVEDKGLVDGTRIANVKVKNELEFTNVKCGLAGNYQLKNIKGVLKAWQVLNEQSITIEKENLLKALLEVTRLTNLKGRWQILNNKPLTICDTGHNEAGIKDIVAQIESMKYEKLYFIIGMVKEKDHDKILSLLPLKAYYIFTQPAIERALKATELQEKAIRYQLKGEIIENVNMAIAKANTLAGQNDLIFIGGSTFVVAEIENL